MVDSGLVLPHSGAAYAALARAAQASRIVKAPAVRTPRLGVPSIPPARQFLVALLFHGPSQAPLAPTFIGQVVPQVIPQRVLEI